MSRSKTIAHPESSVVIEVKRHCESWGHESINEAPAFLIGIGRLAQYLDPGVTPVDHFCERLSNDRWVQLPIKDIVHVDEDLNVEQFNEIRVSTAKTNYGDLNYVCTFSDNGCSSFGWLKREDYLEVQDSYTSNAVYGQIKFTLDLEMLDSRYPKISPGDFWEAFDYFIGEPLAVSYRPPSPTRSRVQNPVVDKFLQDLAGGVA